MSKELSWYEKYQIALKESVSIKDIMKLRGCGQPKAMKIRNDALEFSLLNDIALDGEKVSMEAVFEVTKKDLNYYYQKMCLEADSIKIKQSAGVDYVRS